MGPPHADEFFAYARERHSIYLRRAAGRPWPWSQDPILQQYRFTNVFRELDRVTVWFRDNVRDPLCRRPEVLLATVLFRWFNRVTTGEALFCQTDLLGGGRTAFEIYERGDHRGDVRRLREAIVKYQSRPPYVTGSYIVLGKRGMSKLDGVLAAFDDFAKSFLHLPDGGSTDWRGLAVQLLEHRLTAPYALEDVWRTLEAVPYLGPFMAYEIVTDLRHTYLLDRAPDILTWANPGPGARRGAARVLGTSQQRLAGSRQVPQMSKASAAEALEVMRALLEMSRDPRCWPRAPLGDWPAWEMRDVEHTLCEWDKYERARLGQGRPRQVFHP